MKDEYLQRDTTRKVTKREAGRPIMYRADINEQLLTWLLDVGRLCDNQLPITSQLLKAKASELITPTQAQFKASDGCVQNSIKRRWLVLRVKS